MLTLYDGLTYEPATHDLGEFRVTKFQQQQLALQLTEDLERSAFQNQNPRSMHISQPQGVHRDIEIHCPKQ